MLSPSFRAIAEPSRELARRALYRDGDGPVPSDVESALRAERGDHCDDAGAVAKHRLCDPCDEPAAVANPERCDGGSAAQQLSLHAQKATNAALLQLFGVAVLRLER